MGKARTVRLTDAQFDTLKVLAHDAGCIADRGTEVGQGSITALMVLLSAMAAQDGTSRDLVVALLRKFREGVDAG